MPTYERTAPFLRDLLRLSPEQRAQFEEAVRNFVEDLKARHPIRTGLGIERFHKGGAGVYEFRFAPNGRALFKYGQSPHAGDVHIIWLAVGTHEIYKR